MNTNNVKVLPVPNFFSNMLWEVDDNMEELAKDLKADKLVQTTPTFNRDGWYYNRHTKTCWYEFKGTAWLADRSYFLYELGQLDAPLLTPEEVQALKVLNLYRNVPTHIRKQLGLMWYKHEQNERIKQTVQEIKLWRMKSLKDEEN